MPDRCDHGRRRSSTLERSMRAKQGCSEAKPDLSGLSRLSFRRPFGVAGRQAPLYPGGFLFEERPYLPLTRFAQSAFDRREGKRADRPAVGSANGDADGPRAGEHHARIQSVTLRSSLPYQLAKHRRRMLGILLCQDIRVRGQNLLHFVVRQAPPTAQGSRPQLPAGDGPRREAHGFGSGTALPRDERKWSRRPAGPTGKPCRPFPDLTERESAATSDVCRSVCLREYPGRRSRARGGSAGVSLS